MIERVQKRVTIDVFKNCLVYEYRTTLQLPTLSYRRHHANMLMVYNILHQNVNLQPECFFHQNLSSVTRGHNYKLFKPHAQKNVQSKFSVRTINSWNSLLNDIILSNSINNFKILFDSYYT